MVALTGTVTRVAGSNRHSNILVALSGNVTHLGSINMHTVTYAAGSNRHSNTCCRIHLYRCLSLLVHASGRIY